MLSLMQGIQNIICIIEREMPIFKYEVVSGNEKETEEEGRDKRYEKVYYSNVKLIHVVLVYLRVARFKRRSAEPVYTKYIYNRDHKTRVYPYVGYI